MEIIQSFLDAIKSVVSIYSLIAFFIVAFLAYKLYQTHHQSKILKDVREDQRADLVRDLSDKLKIDLSLLSKEDYGKAVIKTLNHRQLNQMLILIFVAGVLFIPLLYINREPINVTATIREKIGSQLIGSKIVGNLILHTPTFSVAKNIENYNEVMFASLYNLRKSDSIYFELNSDSYVLAYPNLKYKANHLINLVVKLKYIDSFNGKVLYKHNPLPGVLIRITGIPLDSIVTNSQGDFTVSIPEKFQRRNYNVWFEKRGYPKKDIVFKPETGEQLIFDLYEAN